LTAGIRVKSKKFMSRKIVSFICALFLFVSFAQAQSAEVTIQFFETLLDAIFNNSQPLEFPLSANSPKSKVSAPISRSSFAANQFGDSFCQEKITVMREMNGVRTGVKFRDGKIYAPIAFTGTYNPPFVGCVDFQGWADTNIELEFDKAKQTLYGRARVNNVQLGSVANLAGGLIARFVQSSIDKKINPIEILKTDRLDFVVPIRQTNSSLRLKANDMRYEVGENLINIRVNLEFSKAR
jgi:hypothetical protein